MTFLSIADAARIIRAGGIIIYPTETFWAIGCSALIPNAVDAIACIKGRKSDKPFPLIAADADQAASCVDLAAAPWGLMRKFWPGPLSLLLPGKNLLAPNAINPQHKTALRISAAKSARELAAQAEAPLIATSANVSGWAPAKGIAELADQLCKRCEKSGLPWGIVGEIQNETWNAPSTLVEPLKLDTGWRLKILREGAIRRTELISPEWEII